MLVAGLLDCASPTLCPLLCVTAAAAPASPAAFHPGVRSREGLFCLRAQARGRRFFHWHLTLRKQSHGHSQLHGSWGARPGRNPGALQEGSILGSQPLSPPRAVVTMTFVPRKTERRKRYAALDSGDTVTHFSEEIGTSALAPRL